MFGSTNPFGSTPNPLLGNARMAFGASTAPAFGSQNSSLFDSSSSTAFGASSTPAFGSTTNLAFGRLQSISAMNVYKDKCHEQLRWEDYQRGDKGAQTPTPILENLGFGHSTFGIQAGGSRVAPYTTTLEPNASCTEPTEKFESICATTIYNDKSHEELRWEDYQRGNKGSQIPTPILGSLGFGQSTFGCQVGGSRVAPYTETLELDASRTQIDGKLKSISAMTVYKDKSHEELRWEDYLLGHKGGPNPAGQSGGLSFQTSTQVNPFGQTSPFGQTDIFSQTSAFGQATVNPFSSITSSNPFAPKTPAFGSTGFPSLSTLPFSSPFSSSSVRPFGSTSSTPSLFGAPTPSGFASGTSSSIFGSGSAPAFGSWPSIFGSSTVGSASSFGPGLTLGNTQSSGLFSSSPSIGQTPSPFGRYTGFQQSMPAFGSSLFSTPSTGFGVSLFSSSTPSLSNPAGFGQSTPSISIPFQPSAPLQTSNAFSFSNLGQPQSAQSGGFGGFLSTFNQGTFGQSPVIQPNIIMQPTSITNPFGTLPVIPQMSIGRVDTFVPSVQCATSSMPVSDKPAPVSKSSLVAPRHISQTRIRLPPRRYHLKSDSERVPFFSIGAVDSSTLKDDAVIVRPIEQRSSTNFANKQSVEENVVGSTSDNGNIPSAPILDESHSETPTENTAPRSQS